MKRLKDAGLSVGCVWNCFSGSVWGYPKRPSHFWNLIKHANRSYTCASHMWAWTRALVANSVYRGKFRTYTSIPSFLTCSARDAVKLLCCSKHLRTHLATTGSTDHLRRNTWNNTDVFPLNFSAAHGVGLQRCLSVYRKTHESLQNKAHGNNNDVDIHVPSLHTMMKLLPEYRNLPFVYLQNSIGGVSVDRCFGFSTCFSPRASWHYKMEMISALDLANYSLKSEIESLSMQKPKTLSCFGM